MDNLTEQKLHKLAGLCGWRLGHSMMQPKGEKKPKYYFKGKREMHINVWQPHRDIAQAFMVAEAVFGWYSLTRYFFQNKYQYIFRGCIDSKEFQERCDKPALAICRAALNALAE
jgi:hypothetical protein